MCSAFREAFPSPLRGGRTRAKPEPGGGRWTEGAGVAPPPPPPRGGEPTRAKPERRGGAPGIECWRLKLGAFLSAAGLRLGRSVLRPRAPHPYPSPQGGGDSRISVRVRLGGLALVLALALGALPAHA